MDQVITFVYYDGRVVHGDQGAIFEGRRRSMHLKRNITFDRLKKKIHERLKLQRNQMISRVSSRFMTTPNPIFFTHFEIVDNVDVQVMMDAFSQQSYMVQLELYVEVTEAGSSSMSVPTYLSSTQPRPTEDGGRHVVDEELLAEPYTVPFSVMSIEETNIVVPSDVAVNLGDDYDYRLDNDNVDGEVIPSDDDHNEDERMQEGGDESDTDDEGDRHANPQPRMAPHPADQPAAPVNVNVETQGHPNTAPFWSASSHYTYINWDHPDEETDFYSETDVNGSWKLGDDLCKGLIFENKRAVQDALLHYCFRLNQTYKMSESKPEYFTAKCQKSVDGCPWRIRAHLSKKIGKWIISKWGGSHTCLNAMTSQDHKKMTSTFMSNYILGMVSAQPTIPISLIQERISGQLNYMVSYFKAWKAKQKALARVFGDWEESYDLLPRWLEYMLRFSPGSHYEFVTTDYKDQYGNVVPDFKKFGRVFWTYKQCCDAFNYCKPMIQIDGTFLYGKYSGTLLIATTQDGNSNVLPLAFAIVEGETLGAWTWFLRLMRVHVTKKQGICLISDRHASILSAVGNPSNGWQPPNAYHVYCIRHVASNFNNRFHNTEQKNELINMAYEPCPYLFEQRLAAFRGHNTAVRQWINDISNEKWSRACEINFIGPLYWFFRIRVPPSV
ncbi:uncharacterized protein LOC130724698 [Lotus japonicus]|uniref:uncharacterized protein LOC130724698 n=1 Tax=Lotus japonicus TaxID=34305 RepID=UPI002585B0AB|nr:uncharacterized protein LOC130724698 [Lotus japonicus]